MNRFWHVDRRRLFLCPRRQWRAFVHLCAVSDRGFTREGSALRHLVQAHTRGSRRTKLDDSREQRRWRRLGVFRRARWCARWRWRRLASESSKRVQALGRACKRRCRRGVLRPGAVVRGALGGGLAKRRPDRLAVDGHIDGDAGRAPLRRPGGDKDPARRDRHARL